MSNDLGEQWSRMGMERSVRKIRSVSEKLDLWDRVCLIINQYQSSCICVIGNFNSIRNSLEK
ncbi:hypothetical protein ACS0TY_006842 [Phlomoides rotata]